MKLLNNLSSQQRTTAIIVFALLLVVAAIPVSKLVNSYQEKRNIQAMDKIDTTTPEYQESEKWLAERPAYQKVPFLGQKIHISDSPSATEGSEKHVLDVRYVGFEEEAVQEYKEFLSANNDSGNGYTINLIKVEQLPALEDL